MKYSKFLEVAQRADGFAELQKYFINYSGLKDIILKVEMMSQKKVVDSDADLESDLRKQYNDIIAADIAKIDEISRRLISKLDQDFKDLGRTLPPAPTKLGKDGEVLPNVQISRQNSSGSEREELYAKARLVKQYCELNSEGVRKIAKKYDKRGGGSSEQDKRIAEMKTKAFGDGSIDRIIDTIETQLISEGKIQPDNERTALCQKEGVHIGYAADEDAGIVSKFVQVLGVVFTNALTHQPDAVVIEMVDPATETMEDGAEKTAAYRAAVDKWALKEMKSTGKTWGEKNCQEKILTVLMTTAKLMLVALLLYMFIISLGLMGNAFKVLGGKSSGRAFRQSELFSNPVASLSLGILATVLVQSSSTSTSVIITMAAADLVSMTNAIPMIMGANIGTAVTASIVSLAQIGDREQYRRAFGGAIVHYCFNILTVVILLPLEVVTGMLQVMSKAMVDGFGISNDDEKGGQQDFLKVITKPISSRLLQVDKKLVTKIAQEADPVKLAKLEATSIIKNSQSNGAHLFMDTPMSENAAGVLLIIVSLLFLSICLILLVKTLQSVFKGRAAIWIGKFLNLEIKSCPLIGDYILMTFGMGLTILMQSSSVTTSTLTPLVGIGLIRVEKMFPFTIGANIGTTVTGILAALASSNMEIGFQVAMAHLLFNVIGTMMWFMVPAMRVVPLSMAKFLGNIAAEVKIFPVLLIIFAWVGCPGGLLMLCTAGVGVVAVVGGLLMSFVLAVIATIWLRFYFPRFLPQMLLGNPRWLPPSMCLGDEEESRREVWFRGSGGGGGAESNEVSTDNKKGSWWQAPMAWGSGWFILMALAVAVPNCQWANLKYPKFDGRDHVGIGAWQACSKMYEGEVKWAPARAECSQLDLQTCAGIDGCQDTGFSDKKGSNEAYENSWKACREKCSPKTWESHCSSLGCAGSAHAVQCTNVTAAVHVNYEVAYSTKTAPAWPAGSNCKAVSELCDNSSKLGQAGDFGWAGFVFIFLGQFLLMGQGSIGNKQRACKVLVASLASFCLAWTFLLVSFGIFATTLGSTATCTIMDASATGAILATGNFGDIVKGSGSYGYMFVIGSWILTTLVVGVVGHRVFTTRLNMKTAVQ